VSPRPIRSRLTGTRPRDYASAVTSAPRAFTSDAGRGRQGSLTAREREILGLLATGLSGADIAARLVLSPETVRTHVRNAMAKLGASTRSQAVALAIQRNEIPDTGALSGEEGAAGSAPGRSGAAPATFAAVQDQVASAANLDEIVGGLVVLHEIDAAAVYVTERDGMTLRRAATRGPSGTALMMAPEVIALGEGPIGRAALERRAQLVLLDHPASQSAAARGVIVAPMVAGRLVGLICFAVRASRPTGRADLLLTQAFATRLAEVLTAVGNGGIDSQLATAVERFRASWTATTSA
jgi:DNA-binding CsgD family transcriptional regulator